MLERRLFLVALPTHLFNKWGGPIRILVIGSVVGLALARALRNGPFEGEAEVKTYDHYYKTVTMSGVDDTCALLARTWKMIDRLGCVKEKPMLCNHYLREHPELIPTSVIGVPPQHKLPVLG